MNRAVCGVLLLGVLLVAAGCDRLKHQWATEHQELSLDELQNRAESFTPAVGKRGGQIVLPLFSDPRTFNPFAVDDIAAQEVTAHMYDGLTRIDGVSGEPVAALAEQWVVSNDRLHCMFSLRRGLRWSDGKRLSAHDVVFTYNELILGSAGSTIPARAMLEASGTVLKVSAIDSLTVHFEFNVPFSPLLHLASSPILPQHELARHVQRGTVDEMFGATDDVDSLVGSGPFVVRSYARSQSVVLERNPHYWRTDAAGKRLPYLDRIVYTISRGQNDEVVRLGWAEVDFLVARGDDYAFLTKNQQGGNFRTFSMGPARGGTFVAFNLNGDSTGGKPHVDPAKLGWFRRSGFRKAVSHAIDRDAIIREAYAGKGFAQWSPLTPANRRFHAEDVPTYPFDTTRARSILADMGFADRNGDGVVEDLFGNPLAFTLTTNSDNDARVKIAHMIRENLNAIGLRIRVKLVDFDAFSRAITDPPYEWDAALLGITDPLDPSFAWDVWHSSGALHPWHPREARPSTPWEIRIDSLFLAAVREAGPVKRKALYQEWQHVAADQLPLIPTVLPERTLCISARFGNVNPSIYGGLLHNIEELYVDGS